MSIGVEYIRRELEKEVMKWGKTGIESVNFCFPYSQISDLDEFVDSLPESWWWERENRPTDREELMCISCSAEDVDD